LAVTTPAPDIGAPCPRFTLKGVDGQTYRDRDFQMSKCLLVVFTANHCPYARAVEDRIIALQNAYPKGKLQVVAICSNDAVNYPDDSFDNLAARWTEKKMPFPLLHDETQEIAKVFGAVCTPDFFLYDAGRSLAYRGRFDDNWKEPENVTRHELKEAIDALISNNDPAPEQNPSMGCSIKWKN